MIGKTEQSGEEKSFLLTPLLGGINSSPEDIICRYLLII